jgi:hypothetical protein
MGLERTKMFKRTVTVVGAMTFVAVGALSTVAVHQVFAQQLPKASNKQPGKAGPGTAERAPRPAVPGGAKVDPSPPTPRPETIDFGECVVTKLTPEGQYQFSTTLTNRTKSPLTFAAGSPIARLTRTHWKAPWTSTEEIRAPAGGSYVAPGATIPLVTLPGVLAPGAYALNWLGTRGQPGANGVLSQKTCELVPADAPDQPEARPDLTVTSLTVSPPSGSPATTFTFTLTVKNVGHKATGPANANTGARAACLLDGVQFGETIFLANMAPNSTVTKVLTRPAGIVPWTQPHHITCVADGVPHRVTEEREDNNHVTVPFMVQ